jgi:hypothetical protein
VQQLQELLLCMSVHRSPTDLMIRIVSPRWYGHLVSSDDNNESRRSTRNRTRPKGRDEEHARDRPRPSGAAARRRTRGLGGIRGPLSKTSSVRHAAGCRVGGGAG